MNRSIVIQGAKVLETKKIIICGIVRDCAKNLKHNIPIIDRLCSYCLDFEIVIFENDSKDDTKKILNIWKRKDQRIHIITQNLGESPAINSDSIIDNKVYHKYYTYNRIYKMSKYRNQYLDYVDDNKIEGDYLIVVDLDVADIKIDGVLSSFAIKRHWDLITANGQALSLSLRQRYFDTYALCECGEENLPQDSETLYKNQFKWCFLKKGLPLIKVYSAHGGLSIYNFNVIKGCRYYVIPNKYDTIEVKCEHFSFCSQLHEKGYHDIYINPSMIVTYRSLTIKAIIGYLVHVIRRII